MTNRGPSRHQVIYSRLETDAEVLARANIAAGHKVQMSCCYATIGMLLTGADELASKHGVTRRIVEVAP